MKTPQYVEGPQALTNFKQFAGAVLQANPDDKKKRITKPASSKKRKKSDKD